MSSTLERTPERTPQRTRRRINFGFDRFSGLYLWALFIVVFGIWTPDLFLSADTARSILSSQAIVAMLGIALLIPLAAGAYDLSIGATINLSAVLAAWLQTDQGWGMWSAIAMAVLSGTVIGTLNGFIVVRLHVNSFIATLGMATIIGAVITIITDQSQPLPPTSTAWLNLTQYKILGGLQVVVVYLLLLALIIWWFLDHTPAGRYIYATGGNPEAARLSGVQVGKWTWLSLIMSGTIAAIAGVFYSSLSGPSLTFGGALLLPAFAAAFLGSTQLKPGRFNVWGTLIAVYVLATGVKGLQFVTGVQWLNDMFNGVALIVAVAFAVSRQRAKASSRRRGGGGGPKAAEEDPPPVGDGDAVRRTGEAASVR
jgi:ribose transport system permease protein